MRRQGQVSVRLIVGLLVVIVVLVMLGYPAFQRARMLSSLSTRRVDVSMHDPATLASKPYYDKSVGCRLRLPAGLPPAMATSVPEAQAAFIAAKQGQAFVVAVLDRQGKDFLRITRGFRAGVVKSQKGTIEEEGTSDINGMRTYVITLRSSVNGQDMRSRFYCVDGSDGRMYVLTGTSTVGNSSSEIFDSAASTLEIGTWPDEPAPAITETPSAPAPTVTTLPVVTPVPAPAVPPATPPSIAVAPGIVPHVRPIPGNVPVGGMTSAPRVGQKVEVWWGSKWWAAEVMKIDGTQASIHYENWAQEEWVTFDRIREPEAKSAPAALSGVPSALRFDAATQRAMRIKPAGTELTYDAAIVLLGSSSVIDRAKGAEALAGMAPDAEHRAGVVSKLSEIWREKSIILQPAAARALGVWGDDATERMFTERLLTGKKEERAGIFEMLEYRKTKTAAAALAKRLRVPEDAVAVTAHLRKMGDVAEPAVRGILTDTDKLVRRNAVDILRDIGTAESLPSLQKVTGDPDAVVASSAKLAIEAIKGRSK